MGVLGSPQGMQAPDQLCPFSSPALEFVLKSFIFTPLTRGPGHCGSHGHLLTDLTGSGWAFLLQKLPAGWRETLAWAHFQVKLMVLRAHCLGVPSSLLSTVILRADGHLRTPAE